MDITIIRVVSSSQVKEFIKNIRNIIKAAKATKTSDLINILNPKIRGWANYYRHVVSKAIFSKIDSDIFLVLWAWAKRRHPHKGHRWIAKKYFCTIGHEQWIFNSGIIPYQGRYKIHRLVNATAVPIRRHIKIRADANPYDLRYKEYFEKREYHQRVNKPSTWVMAGSA